VGDVFRISQLGIVVDGLIDRPQGVGELVDEAADVIDVPGLIRFHPGGAIRFNDDEVVLFVIHYVSATILPPRCDGVVS
jgi:hypothetical protein